MDIANQKDFLTGIVYIGSGGSVAVASTSYSIGTAARMGPGFFPLCVGLLLVLIGIWVLSSSLAPGAVRSKIGSWPVRSLVIVLLSVVLFGFLVEGFGFLVSVPVLLGVSFFAHPQFSWRTLALSVLVLLPLTWLIFIQLLGLQFRLMPSFI